MSQTTQPLPTIGAPNSAGLPTTKRDQVIGMAKDLPDLIVKAQTFDPALAASLTGKALIASKTVWGTLAAMLVSWAVTRWGLGWDADTCAEVSGVLVMAATAGLRAITKAPVTGVVTAGGGS